MNLLKDILAATTAPEHAAANAVRGAIGKKPTPMQSTPSKVAPADHIGLMRQLLLNVVSPHLAAPEQDIQGETNPGFTPLQNSGFGGKGYAANLQPAMPTYWQNTDGARRNMVNPQVDDNGYYYN